MAKNGSLLFGRLPLNIFIEINPDYYEKKDSQNNRNYCCLFYYYS